MAAFSISLFIAGLATGLLGWAIVNQEPGYMVASALLTASSIYSAVRGPDYIPHSDRRKSKPVAPPIPA